MGIFSSAVAVAGAFGGYAALALSASDLNHN